MSHSSAFFAGRTYRSAACAVMLFFMAVPTHAAADDSPLAVSSSKHAPLRDGPYRVYVGTVKLPAQGVWRIDTSKVDEHVREVYLVPLDPLRVHQLGKRMYEAIEERVINASRWQLNVGYEPCRDFALAHQNVGPTSLKELSEYQDDKYGSAFFWDRMSYRLRDLEGLIAIDAVDGPFVHLIPNVTFEFEDPPATDQSADPNLRQRRGVPKDKRKVLAFELRPLIDDGKHWVLSTDGNCERVDIDQDLVRTQKATIRPILSQETIERNDQTEVTTYTVTAIVDEVISAKQVVRVDNAIANQQVQLEWNFDQAKEVDFDLVENTLFDARRYGWTPYLIAGNGGVLDLWNRKVTPHSDAIGPASPRPNNLSMYSILGGRAAIEETLQMQVLAVGKSKTDDMVELSTLKGVEVKSHPFEAMLANHGGGEELAMASFVPADRFYVYVGKPETIPALLDSGAPFIASLGTALSGNCLQYNLESRYLARLGLNRDWVDSVLTSGMASELSIYTPDLFFIDGTDVTVIARLRQPQLLHRMLSILVIADVTGGGVVEIPASGERNAYVSLQDDLLMISTNRQELELAIDLRERDGVGSLGASDEFRYMLGQLPVDEKTRLYAYLSDPFVRRLVGPEAKIGQRRRVLEKAKLEAITAYRLKAKLDGLSEGETTQILQQRGYLPSDLNDTTVSIQPNGLVRSERYGTLPNMRSLPEVPLKKVTREEAQQYDRYRENYSRYWSRYFDPIAVRLNDVGPGELELSTFILPLVDNSIYNGLRGVLAHQSDGKSLSIPVVQPAPVLQFSLNLRDEAWQQIAGNFSEFFSHYSGVSSAILDDFGPSAHVAVFDADPVIALGSGDVFGAFGNAARRGNSNFMLMSPVMISMLTRPCSIMVETQSPERTAQYLRQAALAHSMGVGQDSAFRPSFYQEGDEDKWVWVLDIFGMVKLRYGVEVIDKYLVIRNIPWSSDDRVVSTGIAALNGAQLSVNPGACQLQLPGLHAAASDNNRKSVMSGLGRLYPFMLAGSDSVESAMAEHQRLFGFHPRQLPGDQWLWEGQAMVSRVYGQPVRQRQPAFDPDQPFGLMSRIDSLSLNMQFESDGLRSSVRWRLR
ncbi:hypothetical protein [Rhodopirellula sp. MGV]|uniref:hypothetical protein n=1 Tax=Rhodopirellula sp. MGV TaxID=2023130 RepID=UPI000B96DF91|nr:hypothetical protein [Rhodopirellula sp. MGV]OYP36366.1 hypothetical protein CGZ80_08620 [Rhodopirellula sp. MGV]PNY38402.1 hypothetical protein C2E31_00160 [Rhodopirellula baltica]